MAENNLQLLVQLNALYSGNAAFNKAGKAMSTLKDKTEALQATAGRVQDFQNLQSSLADTEQKFSGLQDSYSRNSEQLTAMRERHSQLGQEYQNEKSRLAESKTAVDNASLAYAQQAQKVAELSRKYQDAKNNDKAASKSLGDELNAERAKLKILGTEQQKAQKNYKAQSKIVEELSQKHKAAGQEVKQLEGEQKKLDAQISKTASELDNERQKLSELGQSLKDSGINANNFVQSQEKIQAALQKSEQAQKKFSDAKQNLSWDNIKNKAILPAMEAYSTINPFVSISADFEAAMARVKAVAFSGVNANMSEFEDLKKLAAQLGADTQFTSIQAAQSMENLARAGLNKSEIEQAMPALLDMAAAEGMDLAQGAGIMAGAMKGFEGKRTSTQIADMLAFTSANSATSISALGEAVKVAAGTASKLNVAPEKLLSYLGALANRQVEGSQAGATITNALTRLSKADTSKKLNALGIATRTKSGEMVELPEILKQFAEKTNKKGEVWQVAKLNEIFGQGYGKFMAGFMAEVSSGSQTNLQKGLYEGSAGSAKRMADINLDTLQGQLTLLGSAWDGFKTSVGDVFNPIVRTGVETLSSAISKLTNLMKDFPNISKYVTLAIGGLVSMRAITGIASIAKNFLALPGAFAQVVSAGRNVSNVLSSVGGVAPQVGGAFSSLTPLISGAFGSIKTLALGALNPIMAHPIIAGGAALIAGVVFLANHWDTVKEKFFAVCDFCREKWQALSSWWQSWKFPDIFGGIKNYFSGTLANIKNMWSDITSSFSFSFSLPDFNLENFKKLFDGITFPDIFSPIKNSWQNLTGLLSNFDFANFFASIKIPDIFFPIRAAWNNLTGLFSNFQFPNIFSGLTEKALSVIEALKSPFTSFAEWISGIFSNLNPFNWQLPSWLGGGQTQEQKQAYHDRGQDALAMAFGAPGFASGGIVSRPTFAQVAEDGPEAIIPLTDKSRGVPLLYEAAKSLGVSAMPMAAGSSQITNNNPVNNSPVINIHVDGAMSDNNDLADKIAQAVRNAWEDLQSRQERLSYA